MLGVVFGDIKKLRRAAGRALTEWQKSLRDLETKTGFCIDWLRQPPRRVQYTWADGQLYNGRVLHTHADGTVDVKFDDYAQSALFLDPAWISGYGGTADDGAGAVLGGRRRLTAPTKRKG